MKDERDTPQEEDEVEAHRVVPAPTERVVPRGADDDEEVEAHRVVPAPERSIPHPSQ